MAVLYQILSSAIICYLCMSMGLMYAWPSSTIKLFESANTTLHRPMVESELALFGSLSSVGALISTPGAGFILDKLGRKYTAILFSLTHVIAWSMISSCDRVEVLLVAIFISGIGGAVFLVVPVYVSEICHESIRGAMTSGTILFYTIGMLVSYLLGGYLQYRTMIYVCLTMSLMGVTMLGFLKESPMFYLMRGSEENAAKSISFYRGKKPDSKEVLQELNNMRRVLNQEADDASPEEENLKPAVKRTEKLSVWQFIRKSRSTRQAVFVALTLCTASIFQGMAVVQVYAEPLFEEAVPNMSATLCSVLLAVITVIAGFVAAYLTELAGRRPLMIYSSVSSGLCCLLLGTQLHVNWGPHWLTAVFMYLFCVTFTIGAGTVPYVLFAEIFLPEVKSLLTTLVIEWTWLCNFIILFIFNPLVTAMGLGPVFYLFAAVCFASAIFAIFYLPETKGLPVDVIQGLFSKKRRGQRI